MKIAIMLLSGGLDSATTAALAQERGFELIALSFDYGQRHAIELQSARRIAGALGIDRHLIQELDLRAIGGSALTSDIDVPKDREDIESKTGIPITYVPARNTIFLSYALALAEVAHSADIFIGVNAVDYSGYPDCRPEYIAKFQELAALATRAGVQGGPLTIHAPLIEMTKADIISVGARMGVDFSLTSSCYDPSQDGAACGRCDSCRLRRKGFEEAGIADPTRYQLAAARDTD